MIRPEWAGDETPTSIPQLASIGVENDLANVSVEKFEHAYLMEVLEAYEL